MHIDISKNLQVNNGAIDCSQAFAMKGNALQIAGSQMGRSGMRSWVICLALLCLASRNAEAQNRWIVGPGGFPSIHAAYLRAAPGDTILVRIPSDWIYTLSGKGVRIIGDGVTPSIQTVQRGTNWLPRWQSIIELVPAGQVMYLENLRFEGGLRLRSCNGGVVMSYVEARRSTHDGFESGLDVSDCEDVLATHCIFAGNADLRPGCLGRRVGSAVNAWCRHLSLVECDLREGPTGVFDCYWPNGRQYFYGWEALLFHGDYPSPRLQISITRCTISASYQDQISVTNVLLALSDAGVGLRVSGTQAQVASYGSAVSLLGTGTVVHQQRVLPRLQVRQASTSLDLTGSASEPGALVFLGFSLRPDLLAFESIGHHGMLVMDLDRARSGLLDVVRADALGAWVRSYPIATEVRSALRDQVFLVQGLELDALGQIWCSTPETLRF